MMITNRHTSNQNDVQPTMHPSQTSSALSTLRNIAELPTPTRCAYIIVTRRLLTLTKAKWSIQDPLT
jgi:hypothetical protein